MKEKKPVAAYFRKGDGDIIKEKPKPEAQSERKGGERIKFDSKNIAEEEPDFDVFYSPSSEPSLLEDIKEVEEIENNIIMEGEDAVETAVANEDEEVVNAEDEMVNLRYTRAIYKEINCTQKLRSLNFYCL